MKYQKISNTIVVVVTGMALLGGTLMPAFAQTPKPLNTNQTAHMANFVKRADQEIDRRITRLDAFTSRIENMKKISSSEKATLSASIQGQIGELTALKTKIDTDADFQTLLTDVQSITKSRIYALVLPQAAIMAMADRIMNLVDSANAVAAKLKTRITETQSSGKDVSALQTAYSDLTAKISDANSLTQAAVIEVSSLTPDQVDQTKFQSNLNALKDARSKLQKAQQDLVQARKDAGTIIKELKTLESTPSPAVTPTATPVATPS